MLMMKVEIEVRFVTVTPVEKSGGETKEELQAELDESLQQFTDETLEEMRQSAGPGGEVEMKSFKATIVEV